ncbi:hypothetical protein PX701_07220 [Agromyces sp. H3Y2-19a]|uniref:hypothetical protein n=1 Tax=Agromyces TaxID=33877 RepID=UPI001E398112|nr:MULTISPECIES: hypothetical protein [Agromyces]MCD5347362.1 hypothetical protein [Agromyces sp. S2-1-8]MDF0513406.1 hypothetical protein [Agromyces chromiiresistens]
MSALPANVLPAESKPAPRRAPERGRWLRPAPEPGRRAKPTLAYAIIAVAGVAAIVVAQLLLSIAITQGAYDIDHAQMQQTKLDRQEQQLREDLDRVESPQYLAANAEALGMVPNASPVLLKLSDGSVSGDPTPARAGAEASGPLVPNALIDGVPLVTEEPAGETPKKQAKGGGERAAAGAAGAAGSGGAQTPEDPAAPPVSDGLPTPATH